MQTNFKLKPLIIDDSSWMRYIYVISTKTVVISTAKQVYLCFWIGNDKQQLSWKGMIMTQIYKPFKMKGRKWNSTNGWKPLPQISRDRRWAEDTLRVMAAWQITHVKWRCTILENNINSSLRNSIETLFWVDKIFSNGKQLCWIL